MISTELTHIVKAYHEEGFVFPLKVLEKEELKYFRSQYEAHEKALDGDLDSDRFKQVHLHFPWAYKLATHPSILKHIEPILGPDILAHGSSVFCKQPHDNSFISWHQDGHYFKHQSQKYVSAWVALSKSTIENGCMRVIPKTHKTLLPHTEKYDPLNMLKTGLTVAGPIDESAAVDLQLNPGEMSLHDVNLVHGSNPNTSPHKRIGVAIRYVSACFTQELEHHEVIVASGKYSGSHFKILKSPPKGTLEECIVKQREAHNEYKRLRKFKR